MNFLVHPNYVQQVSFGVGYVCPAPAVDYPSVHSLYDSLQEECRNLHA